MFDTRHATFFGLGESPQGSAFRALAQQARGAAQTPGQDQVAQSYLDQSVTYYNAIPDVNEQADLLPELDWTRAVVEHDPSVPPPAQQTQTNADEVAANAANAGRDSFYFGGYGTRTTTLAPGLGLALDAWAFGSPSTLDNRSTAGQAIDKTAADMRALGLPGADPQSGHDAAVKPHSLLGGLGSVLDWVKNNPKLAAGVAAGLLVLTRRRR